MPFLRARVGRTGIVEAPRHHSRHAWTRRLRTFALLGSLLAMAVLLSSCGVFSSPQNTFSPAGEVARDQKNLFLLTMWPALLIMLFVELGLVYILIRFRRRKDNDPLPPQVHGNNRLEIAWTVAPVLLLAVFVPPVIAGIIDFADTPNNAVEVDVTGFQWAWQFAYPTGEGDQAIQSPIGELHIPVGEDILLKLHSPDVNHSFWVPKLAGKTDVIPGRNNHMWLRADKPGEYSGQCAEFCGLGHAQMRFKVIAESRPDFEAWLQDQAGGG